MIHHSSVCSTKSKMLRLWSTYVTQTVKREKLKLWLLNVHLVNSLKSPLKIYACICVCMCDCTRVCMYVYMYDFHFVNKKTEEPEINAPPIFLFLVLVTLLYIAWTFAVQWFYLELFIKKDKCSHALFQLLLIIIIL